MTKEATARIKINKLLEAAGWRFFPEGTLARVWGEDAPALADSRAVQAVAELTE